MTPIIQRSALTLLTISLILVVTGCSSTTVKLDPKLTSESVRALAILPPSFPDTIQREHAYFIRQALEIELRSRGFVVLDASIVDRICPDAPCAKRKVLRDDFMVDGFVSVELASIARNNFIAGYYNSIAGTLTLATADDATLATITHDESESGGVLLQSGQLIQGIIAQVENAESGAQDALALKFVRGLTAKLPRPRFTEGSLESTVVAIRDVAITPLNHGVLTICADATPRSLAALRVGKVRSTLREISPGRYCGAYPSEVFSAAGAAPLVEVRSPYGSAARAEVTLSVVPPCDPTRHLSAERTAHGVAVMLRCLAIAGKSPQDSAMCDSLVACTPSRFRIYRASAPQGPYLKIAEIADTVWIDRSAGQLSSPSYAVVASDSQGRQSRPAIAPLARPAIAPLVMTDSSR